MNRNGWMQGWERKNSVILQIGLGAKTEDQGGEGGMIRS